MSNVNHIQHTGAASSNPYLAIATAYGDYTKKSFEDTKSYVEKLSSVKSFDKALEAQTEYAKTAYDTFVAESQKIGELYREFARQTLQPLFQPWGVAARMTEVGLASWPTSQSQH